MHVQAWTRHISFSSCLWERHRGPCLGRTQHIQRATRYGWLGKEKKVDGRGKAKGPAVLGTWAMSGMVVAKMDSLCRDAQLLVGIEGGGSVPRRWVSLAWTENSQAGVVVAG